MVPPRVFPTLKKIADNYGLLLIDNEVQSSMVELANGALIKNG